jgi:DNA-binding PadR family transcriptional regulator
MTPVFRHGRLRLYLLRLLDEEPRHGYEVIRLLRDRFMGVYAPSPGTIYPRLARLEEEGLVTHDEENGRKVYRITEAGREELRSRGPELDELEEELSASVSDIVREVREDVRDTVRSLREELTRAAREMRGNERERQGNARDTAHETADAAREQAKQAKESAWAQAKQARDEAHRRARRIREEAAQMRDDTRDQWAGAGGWGNWADWSKWAGHAGRPGRSGWPGEHDMAALRDFERLARDFVTDLRSVAWDSNSIFGTEVMPKMRDILADTMDRIRTEVFEPRRDEPGGNGHAPGSAPAEPETPAAAGPAEPAEPQDSAPAESQELADPQAPANPADPAAPADPADPAEAAESQQPKPPHPAS